MCDHCFNASDFQLPSGVTICRDCFYESYCACCWERTDETNDQSWCATCVNNNLPQMHHHDNDDILNNDILNDDILNANMEDDEIMNADTDDEIYYNIINHDIIIPDTIINEIHLLAPPAGFDMNAASLVEENPDYIDNLINAQVEYEGDWYFALDGQIYSVPYEIEIDDHFVRQDIVSHWDDVRWVGSIFGEYIAWL